MELPCGHMFGKGELLMYLNMVDETRCFNNRCPKCLRVLCLKASPPGVVPIGAGAGAVEGRAVAPVLLLVNARGEPGPDAPPPVPVVRQMPQDCLSLLQRSIRRKALAYPGPVKLLDEAILIMSISWLLTTIYKTLNKVARPPALSSSTFTIPIWDFVISTYTIHRLPYTTNNKYTEAIDFLRPILGAITWTHFLLSIYTVFATSTAELTVDAIIAILFLAAHTLPHIMALHPTTTTSHIERLIMLANINRLNVGDFRNSALDWLFTGAMLEAIVCTLLVMVFWIGWCKYAVALMCIWSLVDDLFLSAEWRRRNKDLVETGIPMATIGISCVEVCVRMVLVFKGTVDYVVAWCILNLGG